MQATPSRSGSFVSTDGTKLHYTWTPHVGGGSARAAVVIVHGYGEHSGRYAHVGDFLARSGFGVLAFDYRGHGQAGGRRGHCASFDEFVADLTRACDVARDEAGSAPLALVTHSHGGLISLTALCSNRVPQGVVAATFSSPFLGLALKVPRLKLLAGKVASRVLPTLAMPNGINASDVSHDPEIVGNYGKDTLNHHVATARWFVEATAAQAFVAENVSKVGIPTYWQIGGADPIADPKVGEAVGRRAGGNPNVKVYPGLYHEIYNELPDDRKRVLADLGGWLGARFPIA